MSDDIGDDKTDEIGTVDTTADAYRRLKESGEDVTVRRQVAAVLMKEPMTAHEVEQHIEERSGQSVRPRLTELILMGCAERRGKRENPSGEEAYIHHLTPLGEKYVRGEVDPDVPPRLSELKTEVLVAARKFLRGDADEEFLLKAVLAHDDAKRERQPEWEP